MFYTIREKIAYSKAGKFVCTILRDTKYKNARVHWVQQSLADFDFSRLPKN